MTVVDTIKILKRLRTVQVEYPVDLFAPRRDEFYTHMVAIRTEMKAYQTKEVTTSYFKTIPRSIFSAPARVVEQILKYILIAVSLVVSVLGVQTYWDEIRHFFSPETVDVQAVAETEDVLKATLPSPVASDEAIFTSTPTLTKTPTATVLSFPPTPRPDVGGDNDADEGEKDNSGLHLGQTKTPRPQ